MRFLRSPTARRLGTDVLVWVIAALPLWLSDEALPTYAGTSLPVLQVAGAALLAGAVAVSRRWPVLTAAVPQVASIVVARDIYLEQLTPAVILFAFLLGRRTAGRAAAAQLAALLVVAAAALALLPGHLSGDDWFTAASTLLLTVIVPWAVGQYLRLQADLAAAGFELAARLEAEHARSVGQERLRERARIAADMHDSLGHELGLLAVRASALQVAATMPEVAGAAAELRESAASATDRLRQIIGVLRAEGDPAPVDPVVVPGGGPVGGPVDALVRRAVAYGVDVRLDVGDGAACGLPDATSRAVVRVVQEGLTNATRHATGASVRVVLRRTLDAIEVTVTNGPPAAGAAQRDDSSRPGYGLVGLDERVRLVGGTVTAGPAGSEDPAGWVLAARLPVTPSLGSAPSAPGSPQAALAGARRRLRRGLIITFWTPAVLAVVLVVVFLLRGGTL